MLFNGSSSHKMKLKWVFWQNELLFGNAVKYQTPHSKLVHCAKTGPNEWRCIMRGCTEARFRIGYYQNEQQLQLVPRKDKRQDNAVRNARRTRAIPSIQILILRSRRPTTIPVLTKHPILPRVRTLILLISPLSNIIQPVDRSRAVVRCKHRCRTATAREANAGVVRAQRRVPEMSLVGVVDEEHADGEVEAWECVVVFAACGVVGVGAVCAVDDGAETAVVLGDGGEVEGFAGGVL
jgi:hypothetical protein